MYVVLKSFFNNYDAIRGRGGYGSVNLIVPLKVNRSSVFGLLFI